VGDSDSWTFSASIGDTIVIRVGEISQTNNFTPRIRLQNPSAVLMASAQNTVAAEIAVTATNTGTFTVIVDDAGSVATGTYRLTLARSPGAVFVAPGDEGGPMTNGVMHTGTIDTGDLDVWTFSANSGDAIVVRVGETTDTSGNFTPWVRLYSPNGTLLDSGFGALAGEAAVTATNSGQFTVVVGDANSALSGSGTYRLTLAKTSDPVVVSAGDDGGPMTNGVMHTGTISTGDLDVWTFSANSGDALVVRIGEIVDSTANFTPWIRLFSPTGKLLGSGFGAAAGEIAATATNSGTFLVVAGDGNSVLSGSGTYRLTLAKTPDPVVVSGGDDGGPMTNGVMHTGTISTGDLDLWTFSANSGDAIVVRIGEMADSSGNFMPWIRLFSPTGKLLGSGFGAVAGELAATATNSGTFLVVAGDGNSVLSGSGTYRLTLAKTPDPVVVSGGDDGGPMTNGVMHTGTISTGDLDLWTFSANSGDAIVVRIGEVVDSSGNFTPWIRLYSPSGKLLDSGFGALAGEISVTATNSGTFLVVAGDGNSVLSGSGDYRLTLVKTGDPVVISSSDEGGPMTNGVMHQGTISTGDLDPWTFGANSGDAIVVRMGEIVDSSGNFTPWIRLYSPGGQLLGSSAGALAGEIAVTATNSGTFIVVAADGNSVLSGSGTYRLTLAKTGVAIVTSAGDEGGRLTGAVVYNGAIDVGDLDLWSLTACAGDIISLRMDESTGGSPLTPWIRLYGRDGTLLNTVSGASTAQINRTAPASGNYLIVLGDGNSGFGGSGGYTLTVNGLIDGLKLCTPSISGTNLVFGGIGGTAGSNFVLYAHTNVTSPFSLWTPILTNQFDQFGILNVTNLYNPAIPQRYFRLMLQ